MAEFSRSIERSTKLRVIAAAALLAILALVIYLPSLHGGFLFDDDQLLTNNPLIKSSSGIFRCWYSTHQLDYVPLTISTLWLEWRLWGMDPTGYRVTNLLLHIAACFLIWILLRRLSIPGAYLAALLFAVHPVNVESVAWIEQRKNTLSLVLFLLSILWFLHDESDSESGNPQSALGVGRWYWLSLLAFALAMFSKGSVAVLPFVLLLIAWWQRNRITKRDLLRTRPVLFGGRRIHADRHLVCCARCNEDDSRSDRQPARGLQRDRHLVLPVQGDYSHPPAVCLSAVGHRC